MDIYFLFVSIFLTRSDTSFEIFGIYAYNIILQYLIKDICKRFFCQNTINNSSISRIFKTCIRKLIFLEILKKKRKILVNFYLFEIKRQLFEKQL